VLVLDLVLVEEIGHLLGHHVAIVGDRDDGNFLAGLLGGGVLRLRSGRLLLWRLLIHDAYDTSTVDGWRVIRGDRRNSALFKGFERRLLRKRALAALAGDEVDGFAHGHHDPKIQIHAAVLAGRTGDLLEPVRDIGLDPQIELHIRIDREAVAAAEADAFPFPVGFHAPPVDPEFILLADRAADRAQP
jgi:hypothetical protein